MNRTEFARVTPESVGISSGDVTRFVEALEGGHTEMHGLMVMRHGKVCAEGWWAPYGPGLRHMCYSLTKTYMGTAIGIAYTEGLLRLEDRLTDIFPEYMPENPSPHLGKLTVRNVLCMGTGMTAFPKTSADWVRDFIAMPLTHEPGTAFFYTSPGSTFLGKIIEKLTGQDVYTYLKPRLFDKIGIDAENLRRGISDAEHDMWAWRTVSTTEDNLRLMKLYADGGVWDGERILAEDYVRKATTLQNDNSSETAVNPAATDNSVGYGFQMWLCKQPGAYRADGAYGQFSIVLPRQDAIVSINEQGMGAAGTQKTLDCVWDILVPAFRESPLPEDPEALAALRRKLRRLAVEAPEYRPYAAMKATAGGVYRVRKGSFTLYGEVMGSGDAAPEADEFRIEFAPMEGRVEWLAKDRRKCVVNFAMDGTRRWNRMDSPWNFASECWANGLWEADGRFRLELLWPEAASAKTLRFQFGGDGVVVTENKLSGPPTPGQPVVLETVASRIR